MSEKEETGRCWFVRWPMEENPLFRKTLHVPVAAIESLKKGALICSVNPVEDFSVTYDATRGVEILSYAEPSGRRFDA
jgi:hypothetical protein